jgi:hypothetical protein
MKAFSGCRPDKIIPGQEAAKSYCLNLLREKENEAGISFHISWQVNPG